MLCEAEKKDFTLSNRMKSIRVSGGVDCPRRPAAMSAILASALKLELLL
jgi:hypothetical protein